MISEQELEEQGEDTVLDEQAEDDSLEEQSAEAFAAETEEDWESKYIDMMEEAAVDLEQLEADQTLSQEELVTAQEGFEAFATALITMKEAKAKTGAARKA